MSTDAREDDRRRRGVVLLLVGAVLLLLLGLLGGYVLFGGDAATGANGVPTPTRPSAVLPSGDPVTRPTGPPVVVDGGGQAVAEPSADAGGGSAEAADGSGLATSSRVVGDVAPGSPASLVISLGNPGSAPLVVTAVSARVTSVAGPTPGAPCSVDWYEVEPFRGSRAVPAGGSTTVELAVVFVDSPTVNQDGCKGATYAYTYRVEARQG